MAGVLLCAGWGERKWVAAIWVGGVGRISGGGGGGAVVLDNQACAENRPKDGACLHKADFTDAVLRGAHFKHVKKGPLTPTCCISAPMPHSVESGR